MKKIALLICLALAGCKTAQAPATASGKPEVTIRAPIATIKSIIISNAINAKFSVTKDTDYVLQFDKPSDNLGAALLLGSRYDGVPNERYLVTFAQLGDEVRVVASGMFVTNPGSSYERITPIESGAGIEATQRQLEQVKATAETASIKPAPQATSRSNGKRG